jgi:hypothetical protein
LKFSDQVLIEPAAMEAAILDAEPSLDQGVGGALRLAMSKGYLQKEDSNRPSASRFAHLKAQNYSIEDKTYGYDITYYHNLFFKYLYYKMISFLHISVMMISLVEEIDLMDQLQILKRKMVLGLMSN